MAEDYDAVDWRKLAKRWGGVHVGGEDHDPHRLELPHGAITIFVDMPSYGSSSVAGSFRTHRAFRVRAPFASTDGLEVRVRPMTWLTKMLKDVKTGDEAFDAAFRVWSNDRDKALKLLSTQGSYRDRRADGGAIRRHMLEHAWLHVCVEEMKPWGDGRAFVDGAMQVSFERENELPRDEDEAVAIIGVVQVMLDQLVALGSARDVDPAAVG